MRASSGSCLPSFHPFPVISVAEIHFYFRLGHVRRPVFLRSGNTPPPPQLSREFEPAIAGRQLFKERAPTRGSRAIFPRRIRGRRLPLHSAFIAPSLRSLYLFAHLSPMFIFNVLKIIDRNSWTLRFVCFIYYLFYNDV